MRRFKSIYIILPLILLVFFAGVQPAHAADWGDIFGGAFGWGASVAACAALGAVTLGVGAVACATATKIILSLWGVFGGFDWVGDTFGGLIAGLVRAVVSIINVVIVAIGSILFWLANGLLKVALEINSSIQDSSVVKEGFDIVLNVANLGLVVAIIVVAFMVMLRRTNAKQLLIRFITVALLINFSFFIVTNLIIKPVNEITDILRSAANFSPTTFASVFAPGGFDFGILFSGFLENPPPDAGDVGAEAIASAPDWGVEILVSLLSVLFFFSFIGIGVFVLFAFAAMFFIRYIALSFLIVIMPIALLAWVFPNLKIPGGNPWSLWVESFTRWLLFAPIGMFFFFLAIKVVTAQDVLGLTNAESGTLEGGFEQFGTAVANMMIVIGFLLGGLIVANKMSITGAGYAMGVVNKAGDWAKTKAANKAKLEYNKARERFLNKPGRKKTLENLSSIGSERGLMIKTASAPLRGLGKGAIGAAHRAEGGIHEYYKKKYEKYAPYRMAALLESGTLSEEEEMALYELMQERGYLWESNAAQRTPGHYRSHAYSRLGYQQHQNKLIVEGMDPRVEAYVESIIADRKKEDIPDADWERGVAGATSLYRTRGAALSNSEISSVAKPYLADYDPGIKHYRYTKAKHDMLMEGRLRYITRDRATAIASLRGKQLKAGQTNTNKAVREHLQSPEVRDILSFRKENQPAVVAKNWDTIVDRLTSEHGEVIDSIEDENFSEEDRENEKVRYRSELESLGSEGYLRELHILENSQKAFEAVIAEDLARGEEGESTTPST